MGCQVCRARKVKCDGRPYGCSNCVRLGLGCDLAGGRPENPVDFPSSSFDGSFAGPAQKPKRAYRSCTACRLAKTKCINSGDGQSACLRCSKRSDPCVYNASSKPIWTRVLSNQFHGPLSSQPNTTAKISDDACDEFAASPYILSHNSQPSLTTPLPAVSSSLSSDRPNASAVSVALPAQPVISPVPLQQSSEETQIAPTLKWLYSSQLPQTPDLLYRVIDQYFCNVHPLRCFAFVHKPSFMRQLDAGYESLADDETALLRIICAHGAKFCALAYSETVLSQPAKLIQAAGHEWAMMAEQTLMTNYGRITVSGLMTAVLLYDYRYRLGDFAHALIMSGVITRMAHALQLNMEYHPRTGAGDSAGLSSLEKESRRRLMWACYVIDTWTGSGVDQLMLLREDDLHIQLPCNERDFLLRRPSTRQMLSDTATEENMDMMSTYIRLVAIWRRVSRYVKHLDSAKLPWLSGSEFSVLEGALHTWRENLAPHLDFTQDSIYTSLESSQLGALSLLHCTYYNAMLDLYRISIPELFSLRNPFVFPREQKEYLQKLQIQSFHHACTMAIVLEETAARGARFLADSMTPMFAYNSSRVMLYYLVRLHDHSQTGTESIVERTIRHVQSNNRVLKMASMMMPLSEPLLITTERWLRKIQSGFHTQNATTITETLGLRDINAASWSDHTTESAPQPDTPDSVLHPLSLFRLARKTLNDKTYSELSSRGSYAGGGLPPLRDTNYGKQNNDAGRIYPPELERLQESVSPTMHTAIATSTTSTAAMAATPPTSHTASSAVTPAFVGWENATDDLALGLYGLQDSSHWDISGIDHMSGTIFDDTNLAAWLEYRGRTA